MTLSGPIIVRTIVDVDVALPRPSEQSILKSSGPMILIALFPVSSVSLLFNLDSHSRFSYVGSMYLYLRPVKEQNAMMVVVH